MFHRMIRLTAIAAFTLCVCILPLRGDFNEEYVKATKTAIAKAAPSVVQIVTQGGTDIVRSGPKGAIFRKALGPTTGVIVSKDGYIISSAFNFINNPSTILVEAPGRKERYIAKKIATDTSRMLTLLKVDAKDLPVPQWVPKKELAVGQWSLALGRTLDKNQDNPPSVSIGIISALGRVWGKCIQTDANTSPVNYGGPLVDIQGRVQGIIIPASPRGTGETAGFEWYDSGIGFAIPMEDIMTRAFPRLKKGKDVKAGLLGVRMRSRDMYSAKPAIGSVMAGTAADRAGLKPGDVIVEIDGKGVGNFAQIKHILGSKYEGDAISLKIERGGKTVAINQLELIGKLKALASAYLGVLPMRDDPKLGVEIRHVFAGSPADKAGLKAGDRITKYGKPRMLRGGKKAFALRSFSGKEYGRIELKKFINSQRPGAELRLQVTRKGGKSEAVSVKLTRFPGASKDAKDVVPKALPKVASAKKALAPLQTPKGKKSGKKKTGKKEEVETGLHKRTSSNGNSTYWVYIHDDYDPNIAHSVLVWLHPPKKNREKDFEEITAAWDEYCRKYNILIVAPTTDSVNGWTPSDGPQVQEVVRDVLAKYSVDKQRVVAHGLGIGGQMAIWLGFNVRDLVSGVASTGAVPTGLKDNVPNRPLQFFLVAGDRDPLVKAIRNAQPKLLEHELPVIYREIKGMGRQYLDENTLSELVRWIDMLDRM